MQITMAFLLDVMKVRALNDVFKTLKENSDQNSVSKESIIIQ